jgi:hypothetical protein
MLPTKDSEEMVVGRIEDQGDRVLLHASEGRFYAITSRKIAATVSVGDRITCDTKDCANFGWFLPTDRG